MAPRLRVPSPLTTFIALIFGLLLSSYAPAIGAGSGIQDARVRDAELLRQKAAELDRNARYKEALPIAEKAVAEFESALGPLHQSVADGLMTLGSVQFHLTSYAAAVTSLTKALEIREKAAIPDNAAIGRALSGLANAKRGVNQVVEADALFKRAIAVLEKTPGAEQDLAGALTSFGSLQTALANFEGSAATLARAVKIYEGLQQTNTMDFAVLLSALGGGYFRLGAFDKAREPFERSLEIRRRLLAPSNPNVARGISNLAATYQELGQFDLAEPLHREVLAVYEAAPAPPQVSIATVSNNLAMIRLLREDYAGAEPLFARALTIRETVLGAQHVETAKTLETMAVFFQTTNRRGEALEAMSRSTDIIEHNLRSMLNSGSETDRSAYMTTVQENTDIALSMRAAAMVDNRAGVRLGGVGRSPAQRPDPGIDGVDVRPCPRSGVRRRSKNTGSAEECQRRLRKSRRAGRRRQARRA